VLFGDEPGARAKLNRLVTSVGLSGLVILVCNDLATGGEDEIDSNSSRRARYREFAASERLSIDQFTGTIAKLFSILSKYKLVTDFVLLTEGSYLSTIINMLSDSGLSADQLSPDIAVICDSPDFCPEAYLRNPDSYKKIIYSRLVTMYTNIIYFSYQENISNKIPYGTMIYSNYFGISRFFSDGHSVSTYRSGPTVKIFRDIINKIGFDGKNQHNKLFIQYDDNARWEIGSVAYGRSRGANSGVALVPDPQFINSHGYQAIRDAVLRGRLPSWRDRRSVVFWRGSPTTNFMGCDGTVVENLEQIPRVKLCLALKDTSAADVAIMESWVPAESQLGHSRESLLSELDRWGIFRPMVPILEHAKYRLLIDIDGVANAWSLFEKLLLGSCVIKVGSSFEQWFYQDVEAWSHFVPVRHDLSDLHEKLEWCLAHNAETRAIAARGQRFALQHTYDVGRNIALAAVRRSTTRAVEGVFHAREAI
jgi:hypothetical protein